MAPEIPLHDARPAETVPEVPAGFGVQGEALIAPVLLELVSHPSQLPGLLRVALDSRKALAALERCAAVLFGGG